MARVMKDSGIEWLGKIPVNWDTISFWQAVKRMATGLNPRDNFVLTKDDPLFYVTIRNFKDGVLYLDDNCDRISYEAWEKIQERSQLKKGDILFASISKDGQAYILPKEPDNWNINESVFCIRIDNERFDEKYFYYHLIDDAYYNDLRMDATGTTFQSIKQDKLKKSKVVLPPMEEQQKIANFLDSKCASIDAVIEKTKASIEEYKKLKQAIITQAVTKGIRPNRKMKDSGIEWIGEIPEEWELKPFRRVLIERNEKNSPVKSTERLSLSIDLGVTLYSEKTTNLDRFKDDFEQYKIAHEGDLVMNSMNMIVGASGVSDYFGCVSPVYYTYYDETDDHITAKYCEYIFRSKTMLRVLYSLGKGIYAIVRGDDRVNTCRLKIAKEDLKSLIIPVPSVEEQREINNYIIARNDELEMLITKKEEYLGELNSLKKSLIYEYVTGKKEVPDCY